MAKKYAGTFLGTGKGLVTIKDHCYAYSGEISVTNDAAGTTMLEFSVGNEYIIAGIQMTSEGASGTDFFCEMKLNGEIIFSTFMDDDTTPYPTGPQPVNVLIPPNSTFSFALKSDASTRVWTASLIGRIYDA